MLDPVCVKPGRWSGEVLIKRTHCPGFRVKSDCRRPWGSVCGGALQLAVGTRCSSRRAAVGWEVGGPASGAWWVGWGSESAAAEGRGRADLRCRACMGEGRSCFWSCALGAVGDGESVSGRKCPLL